MCCFFEGGQIKDAHHAELVNVPLSAFEHGGGALWPSCGKAQEGLHPLTHIICECMLRLGFPSQRPVHRVRESGNERCVCVCVHTPSDESLSRVYGRFLSA